MLAERGANKSDGWGLGSSAAEWSMCRGPAGRELMRPKAETRSVVQRAVSSARSRRVLYVCYVPGDQQEGPLSSRCCSGRRWKRKGAPSVEKPPVKEHGLWARWKAKAKSLRKQLLKRLEERFHNSKSSQR